MSVGVIFLPILILLALALGVLVYYICYKAAINRKLREEESGAHVPMASMETVWKVVAVIAVFVMYSSLNSKITNLQNELNNTRNKLMDQIHVLQYELHEMQEAAKKEASLISAVSYDFGTLDTKEHTAELTFSVMPKSYSQEAEVSLLFRGERVALTNGSDGTFTGSIMVPIFEDVYEECMIYITEGGVTKTEEWENAPQGTLYYECIPQLLVMSNSFGYQKGNGKVTLDGELRMMSTEKDLSMFRELTFYVRNGGTVVDEIPMENGSIAIDRSYVTGKGDSFEFYVTGVDDSGYTHQVFVGGWHTGEASVEMGADAVCEMVAPLSYQVYAPDGTPLIK